MCSMEEKQFNAKLCVRIIIEGVITYALLLVLPLVVLLLNTG